MKIIPGGICAVKGVLAAGSCVDEYGVAVILSPGSNASAVYTSNKIIAAPLIISQESLRDGQLSAIVANSGNANCFTGEEGLEDARQMVGTVSEGLNLNPSDIAVASTGIIGRKLPMDIITPLVNCAIKKLENSVKASKNAAEAIMTTDTVPKEFAVETLLKTGEKVRIGGIAKGSGMIAPNMGTLLSFITTDIKASPQELKIALKEAVDKTLNLVVIDGDVSTNDIVIIMANGRSGRIDENFQEALEYVCSNLARMIAKDGEGATKLMEVEVKGAKTFDNAKKAAKSIVTSPLFKSALFGSDPNWGRIMAAVGYSGAEIDEKLITVTLESGDKQVKIVETGVVIAFEGSEELEIAEKIMKQNEIKIIVDLALGECNAKAYGCDLSYEYVRINAEYSS
ncbi:MAG: bifunctional ornithine acetyltransferase/N-acetylglutamate synthase [Methanobacterium sp.]|jgi:glutamate N-acetyltransferase/amino-acid N-acetyltransferase